MAARKNLTRAVILDIVNRRARGQSLATIGAAHGISTHTVGHHLTLERPITQLAPCGTNAAWHRHRRRREQPCPACYAAHADEVRAAKQRARARKDAA